MMVTVVRVMVVAVSVMAAVRREPFLAMEGHEHEAERVERGDEHADQHAPVAVPGGRQGR